MKSFKCESNIFLIILTCTRHDMALYSVFYSEACFCLSQNKTRSKTDNGRKNAFRLK